MVKLSLQCAIVGEVGSSFDVKIDDGEKVDELKDAIKAKKTNDFKDIDADKLHLFLAKTEGGAWLLEESDPAQKLECGEKPPEVEKMLAKNKLMSSWTIGEVLRKFGMTGAQAPSSKQVHVLVAVVVPTAGVVLPPAPPVVPNGPDVDLDCESLLDFLEDEMIDKAVTMSSPHILEDASLQFRLVGREKAIKVAAKCYNDIIAVHRTTASERTQQPIPVCSGVSGLGKTRMLEEGRNILTQVMKLDPNHIASVIVPYFNGYSPHPVEQSMPIEASFSWRLLYRVFLAKNCSRSFKSWFESRLPCNGGALTLERAVEVVVRKLRQKMERPESELLYLFLGVDDYQRIQNVGAPQKDAKTSLVRELVRAVGTVMCSKLQDVVLLPMFAGTDLDVIGPGSIASSSFYVTERLPMNLLTVDEMFSVVESKAEFAVFLEHYQFCRNLVTIGGVPRWVVEYLLEVKRCWASRGANEDILDVIDASFVTLRGKYMMFNMQGDDILENNRRLVRLAAFAVSGQMVDPAAMFDGPLTWARLRDSSICLLIPNKSALCSVRVPYALLYDIGSRYKSFGTEAERQFARSLKDLNELVDSSLFVVQPWQAWEMFGACFYALRINALLLLGRSTVTLGELLPGAMMTPETRGIAVKLVTMRVIQCAAAFGVSTPQLIPRKRSKVKVDWTSTGCIAVNGDSGTGVDIFFALEDAETGQVVVVVDQRKRQLGTFEPSHASDYFDKLSACPDFLVKDGARLVRGVMNCAPSSTLATYEMPHDCFVLSRDKAEQFHGTLAYHPASSPVVAVNSTSKTTLKTAFRGKWEDVDEVVEEIVERRAGPSGRYTTSEELFSFIKSKRLKVDQVAEFSA